MYLCKDEKFNPQKFFIPEVSLPIVWLETNIVVLVGLDSEIEIVKPDNF